MTHSASLFVCHGCGALVDAGEALPFRCPNTGGDDVDHLLVPQRVVSHDVSNERFSFRHSRLDPESSDAPLTDDVAIDVSATNPFLRYRRLLSTYRLAHGAGLSDDAWQEIVGRLDESIAEVDGSGFRLTPMTVQPQLGAAAGVSGNLWVKDETANVSGSHKARHLMGVMLYLQVLEAARLPLGENLRARPLAIASCGNAALAAAVIARAANWPLDVFIPPDASPAVVRRLQELGARSQVCERRAGEAGDPCFLRFREAVNAGAIPFGVQGTENGLAVEGGRTLAFEMAETFASAEQNPDAVFVQVGGGALASALAQGFFLAAEAGIITRLPKLFAVQTAGCAPLDRAWRRIGQLDLKDVVSHRSRFMWPRETAPVSCAHGILDDETYDWLEIAKALRQSGGESLVAGEDLVTEAHRLACSETSIRVSATGSAGLAGVLAASPVRGNVAVIFSGVER